MTHRLIPPPLAAALLMLGTAACLGAEATPPRTLRVCADPNNLPFSNARGEGFENRIASLLADDLDAELRYTWWAQRRGFVRNTLQAGECDLIIGVPAGVEGVATTAPYYRSTFVFVSREDRGIDIASFDDARLRRLRIGVHLVGDDYRNPPPADALARRGMVRNVVGYSIYGDYAEPDPPARIIEAVAEGAIDVAVVWGPLGGYFASREGVPLRVTPVREAADGPGIPFTFAIAIGVRPGDSALERELSAALIRRSDDVRRILDDYHVPRAGGGTPAER